MGLEFRKITSGEPVARYLAGVISDRLKQGQSLIWLVPGGSAISIAAETSTLLADVPVGKLTVTLTDERYGPPGHPDSNWEQLQQAGFTLPGAALLPVLSGGTMEESVAKMADVLANALELADYKLGFFGIGSDGHTAGVLPGSPAVDSPKLVAGYTSNPYHRITVTPLAISKLDEAVVYASGEAKWPVFDQMETFIPVMRQPAQVIKLIPKVTIFNDYKGGNT